MINLKVTDRSGVCHDVEGSAGDYLMEVLREFDWGVEAICGGMCSCATCHVFVDDAWLDRVGVKDEEETELLDFLDYGQENSRLSCQIELKPEHEGLAVTLAPEE